MSPGKPRVLCVDDEPMVLQGLELHLRRRFELATATSGFEGLAKLEREAPFEVVLSDMRMPGMSGAEFLAKARVVAPDATRVLLTGHADFASAQSAVNDGQIFRFLTKPCPPADILATLLAAVDQHRLVTAEKVLLEQTLTGAVRALSELLALSNPLAFGRAARIHRIAVRLCDRLKVRNRWPIEVAAELCQIGAIQLPAAVAEKLHFGKPLTPAEQALAERGPAAADQLLANIPRLEPVREILLQQRRAFDGTDAPQERLRGEDLPLGARLLRVALDFDALEGSGAVGAQAVAVMEQRPGLYDLRVLEALAEDVGAPVADELCELPVAQLVPGMILAADLRTRADLLLVARGYVVSTSLLMKLQGMGASVVEPIRVTVPRALGWRRPAG